MTARPVTLVTGASSGIGAALARRIAVEGRDLVLTARRRDRLEALAREITDQQKVRVEVIAADLARPEAPRELVAELEHRGLEVEWLVNNAGFGTGGRFDRLPLARELEEIRVNVRAPVELAGRLMPAMVRRGRGAVITVASIAGFGPMAYMATYAATKAFLVSWSEAVATEAAGTGVAVLCVCPGFTRTEFQERAGVDTSGIPPWLWMSAEEVAEETVRAVGRQTVLVPGMLNWVASAGMRLAPRSMIARMTASANQRRTADRSS